MNAPIVSNADQLLALMAEYLEWFPEKRIELQAQQARLEKSKKGALNAAPAATSFLAVAFGQQTNSLPPEAGANPATPPVVQAAPPPIPEPEPDPPEQFAAASFDVAEQDPPTVAEEAQNETKVEPAAPARRVNLT